jgi:O-glycosyl hydrolase
MTTPTPRLLSCLLLSLGLSPLAFSATEIVVDGAKTYQTMEGFGTSLTSWGNYAKENYTDSFAKFYREEVGLNILREALDGFSHPEVTKPSEISWKTIVVKSPRGSSFSDFATKLKKLDPNIRIIGTVWTPPAWMKENRHDNNGSAERQNRGIKADSYGSEANRVAPEKFEHFVQWLVAVADWHKHNGIPLYAISPANEPRFSQWYGSCIWTAKDLATIVGMLGEALEKAGHGDVLIYGPEDMTGHNYAGGTKSYIDEFMKNPAAKRHLDRFATHGYTDGVMADTSKDSSAKFWAMIKPFNKAYWMTEGGTKGHTWPEPVRSGIAQAIHNSLVSGNASAFVPWQISDPTPSTHGIAVNNTATKKTYATMHFSRSIPVNALRIDTRPAFGDVQTSAFLHPESRKLAVVLINPRATETEAVLDLKNLPGVRQFEVRRTSATEDFKVLAPLPVQGTRASIVLPPDSIVSLAAVSGTSQPTAAASPVRTWTNAEGKSIEAAFVSYDGVTLVIRKDGTNFSLPAAQFSQADQDWLAANQAAHK